MQSQNQKKRSIPQTMYQLVKLMRPLAPYMCVAVLMGTFAFLCGTALGPGTGALVLTVLGRGNWVFKRLVVFLIAMVILRGIFRYAEQYLNHYIAFQVLAEIRDSVFQAMRRLAPAKLQMLNKGDLISLISGDIELLEVFYAHTISPICIAVLTGILYLLVIGRLYAWGALIVLCGYLAIGVVLPVVFGRKAQNTAAKVRKSIGGLNNSFLDLLRGVQEILQFSYEKKAIEQVEKDNQGLRGNQTLLIEQLAQLLMWEDFFGLLTTLVLVLCGRRMGIAPDTLFLAVLTAFFSFGPVKAVASLGNGVAQTLACGNRVLDLLQEEPQVTEVTDGIDLDPKQFDRIQKLISVQNLNFAYENRPILNDLTCVIQAGEIIGIQGDSGSGKSTFLKLLLHFWEPTGGSIQVNGYDLSEINTASLWKNIAYMNQSTELFEGSIRENLLIAKEDASETDLELAMKKASIWDSVCRLPNGPDTYIAELGDNFSGGERQRLGLARCFLKDAPILLLDEPTSNLDGLNERIILRAVTEHMEGKTVILVSHRSSTLNICQRVLTMQGGRLVE